MKELNKYDLFEYIENTIEEIMGETDLNSDKLSGSEKYKLLELSENIHKFIKS